MIQTTSAQYKLVLVGDSAVGKSSILNRFVDDKYSQSFLSTIGVDFKFRKINIDGQIIKMQIWDTAGQQTFRSIVSAYYSSADAIIIVYDISSYQSFQNIKQYWIKEVDNNNKNNAKVYFIGNKYDLSKREVQSHIIQEVKEEHNIQQNFQVSAKYGTNILESFTQIGRALIKNQKRLSNGEERNSTNSHNSNRIKQSKLTTVQLDKDSQQKPKQYKQLHQRCCIK